MGDTSLPRPFLPPPLEPLLFQNLKAPPALPVCASACRPLERARIEAAGGQVLQVVHDSAGNPVGPFRLCGSNLYMAPRPMVSRAFGDTSEQTWA